MTEIPKTLPCYLTINQSENCVQADHTPYDLLPHTVFRNSSLKATGEFGSFEHKLPILPAWCPAINAVFPSPQSGVGRLALLQRWMSRPKFGSVTIWVACDIGFYSEDYRIFKQRSDMRNVFAFLNFNSGYWQNHWFEESRNRACETIWLEVR